MSIKSTLLGFFFVLCNHAHAYNTPQIAGTRVVSLGSGFDSARGVFLGERVTGSEKFHGSPKSEWKFKTNLSSAEKINLINGNAEADLDFKVFSVAGGLDLDYVSKKTNKSFGQTMYFEVVGKNIQLDACVISPQLKSSLNKFNRRAIFGDSFVDSLTLGGRLILDLEVTYGSDVDSVEVDGRVKLEVIQFIKGSARANVKIENILEKSQIVVRAKQIGGDPTRLSSIFQNGENLISCGAGNYKTCSQVIKAVIQYGEKFGQQLAGLTFDPTNPLGPAVVGFTTKRYEHEGLDLFPESDEVNYREISRLQNKLTAEYFRLIEDIKYVDEKIATGFDCEELVAIKGVIERNIEQLVSAIQNCADNPNDTSSLSRIFWESRAEYKDPTTVVAD